MNDREINNYFIVVVRLDYLQKTMRQNTFVLLRVINLPENEGLRLSL